MGREKGVGGQGGEKGSAMGVKREREIGDGDWVEGVQWEWEAG